jgi:molybdopterin-guanine dinucleotide biosynthesis protein A
VTIGPALILLAGGRSSRMGRAKHELPVGDTTLLSWLIGRFGPLYTEVIVVGAAAPERARSVSDLRSDAGPLAGIEAGLLALRVWDRAFVLSVDNPRATPSLGAYLVRRCEGHDAAVPRLRGRPQPTVAAYARSVAPKIAAYLDSGKRRATDVLDALDTIFVDDAELASEGFSSREFADLDTPADYEAFLAELRT